jgi:hypothetical protein
MKTLTRFDRALLRVLRKLSDKLHDAGCYLDHFTRKYEDEHCCCEVCQGRYQKGRRGYENNP